MWLLVEGADAVIGTGDFGGGCVSVVVVISSSFCDRIVPTFVSV